jgi:hypothetical protein
MTNFDVHDLTSVEAVLKLRNTVATDLQFLDMLLERFRRTGPSAGGGSASMPSERNLA